MAKKEQVHVAFHESVTGLQRGSPVTLSGVNVGRVETIQSMSSPEARTFVRKANALVHTGSEEEAPSSGTIISGKNFLKNRYPLVLVTAKVKKDSIPLNLQTHVSLITTNVTGKQAVRFSTGSGNHHDELSPGHCVISADPSPLTTLRRKFLGEPDNGVLRRKNIKHLNQLIENLDTVSDQLARITGEQNQQRLNQLLGKFQNVAVTLDGWVQSGPDCPEHGTALEVKKIQEDGKTKYRYRCPESGKEWVTEQPRPAGRLTKTINRLNMLLDRMNRIMDNESGRANIPGLVEEIRTLSQNLNRTVGSVQGLVEENRTNIRQLIQHVNRLSKQMNTVMTQLNQDPSSAVFGRRGPEIQQPFERK